jgi:hypothetical protein
VHKSNEKCGITSENAIIQPESVGMEISFGFRMIQPRDHGSWDITKKDPVWISPSKPIEMARRLLLYHLLRVLTDIQLSELLQEVQVPRSQGCKTLAVSTRPQVS